MAREFTGPPVGEEPQLNFHTRVQLQGATVQNDVVIMINLFQAAYLPTTRFVFLSNGWRS